MKNITKIQSNADATQNCADHYLFLLNCLLL